MQPRDVPRIQDYKLAYVTISMAVSCLVYNIRFWVAVIVYDQMSH
jgi:hypothetical protein